jgi:hypothetical protein
MTPIEKCKMLYTADSPRTFEEDMLAHLSHGCFFSTPEYVMMARPVCSAAPQEMINDVWCGFQRKDWDAWYVYAFALADDQGLQGLVKKHRMGEEWPSADFLFDRQTHPKICASTTRPRLT